MSVVVGVQWWQWYERGWGVQWWQWYERGWGVQWWLANTAVVSV